MLKVGLIKETKIPPDRRTPITPSIASKLKERFPNVSIKIQKSQIRCFADDEYKNLGFEIVENIDDCDILIGLKEVSIESLVPNKTYMFFAHVAKKQEHNKKLLKTLIDKNITLIDYEYLTDENGTRLVAFGKWAGIIGAYNALRMWGLKTRQYELQPAHKYIDKKELFENSKIEKIEPLKIVITGGGRVAMGAIETLTYFGIEAVPPEDFLTKQFNKPVFTKLDPNYYVAHKEGKTFDLTHFFAHPEEYYSIFEPYTKVADMYIACHYWDPKSPKFITREMMLKNDFKIRAIADISCDVNGPIESTIRASSIQEPFYDYNPKTGQEEKPFSSDINISVMAVDNLPSELPRDSSEEFSNNLFERVFPELFEKQNSQVIERATIVKNGKITERYSYLEEWIKK